MWILETNKSCFAFYNLRVNRDVLRGYNVTWINTALEGVLTAVHWYGHNITYFCPTRYCKIINICKEKYYQSL